MKKIEIERLKYLLASIYDGKGFLMVVENTHFAYKREQDAQVFMDLCLGVGMDVKMYSLCNGVLYESIEEKMVCPGCGIWEPDTAFNLTWGIDTLTRCDACTFGLRDAS